MTRPENKLSAAGPAYGLAYETSTERLSVAICENGTVIAEEHIQRQRSHAQLITALTEDFLQHLQLERSALTWLALSEGPGSYTGLRIGAAAAKGLCFALGIPLIAVPTLQALAWPHRSLAAQLDAWLIPTLDGRRNTVYTQVINAQGAAQTGPAQLPLGHDFLPSYRASKAFLVVGPAAQLSYEQLADSMHVTRHVTSQPTAGSVAEIGHQLYTQRILADAATFTPAYLKAVHLNPPKAR